ncbi:armadillo-type protein [Gamsiella multidivaricata]|uniref:armadillo-type protein n=1 Tax=Gamsiella multidivaricata TaxID=101098 RepID=UPI00221ECF33|nr:armadillo-type protein [Gamsiella multidivaricata]KAI7818885.1 armadillo-type protein [Gamsiella multidivaricata]
MATLPKRLKRIENHPSAIDSQIPRHVQKLEDAKTQLEQDADSQEAWDLVANAFQFFADAAKEENARTPIGDSKAVALIVSLEALNKQRLAHVDIQAMRAFANICVDHEANRKKILEENAFTTIIEILRHTTHADAIKTACGALLNTTMACEPAQNKAIELDAIEQLLKVLQSENIDDNEISMTIASRVIANLSELDAGAQSVVKFNGIKTIVQLLQKTAEDVEAYMDLMDALTDILRAVTSKESAQTVIQKEGLLPPLLDILEHAGTSDEGKSEEEKKEDDKKFGETKAALVEVVVSVTLADANMVPIFNDKGVMDKFLAWLNLADREDLQACAALCLGNVARSDQHCVKLVHEYHAVEPLIHVVRKATDLKASHAATGVLRNLALPEINREIMGDAGVIQACFPLLKKDNALPLQANVVGILKRLCTGNSHNTIRVISGREPFETLSSTPHTESENETPLSTLVDVIGRTDDFPLKSEGTRTLCNLIKVIWGSESMKEFDTVSVTALQQTLNKPEVVLQIAAMTRNPKYIVLQNEGVIALTLLVTSPAREKNAVLDALVSIAVDEHPDPENTISEEPLDQAKQLTLLESLLSLIKNKDGKCPDEVRMNVCVLLRNALDSGAREGEDSAYLAFLRESGIKDTLTEVKSKADISPLIRTSVQEVLSRLE